MARTSKTAASPSSSRNGNTNSTTTSEAGTAAVPRGILRTANTTTTTSSQPAQDQTRREVRMMPREFDALVALGRLQRGKDAHQTRQQELARLEAEDPVGHYYAQTPAERAPHALEAAGVLFEMSGGDLGGPVAALTLMKMRREEEVKGVKVAGACLLGGWKTAKAEKEAGEGAEGVQEGEGGEGKGKRVLPAEEGEGEERPRKKKRGAFAEED